ncbi:MAG: hypothetical protein HON76_18195 [Candidatus Scalindua sp.]|jgi:hypothetical protein|nr:hypothetical protein [Candidatus Scalindua sp.]MBT6231083.1 hypothetical protein [Candidatus Scalindua sp.]MBT6564453.1 hypothetical protein [Candidatus Scalindua sp.]
MNDKNEKQNKNNKSKNEGISRSHDGDSPLFSSSRTCRQEKNQSENWSNSRNWNKGRNEDDNKEESN